MAPAALLGEVILAGGETGAVDGQTDQHMGGCSLQHKRPLAFECVCVCVFRGMYVHGYECVWVAAGFCRGVSVSCVGAGCLYALHV